MSGRQSAAVDRALKEYKKGDSIHKLAKKHGIAHTTLYRAIARKK